MNDIIFQFDPDDLDPMHASIESPDCAVGRRRGMRSGSADVVVGLREMMERLSALQLHVLETFPAEEIQQVAGQTVGPLLMAATGLFDRVLQTMRGPGLQGGDTDKVIGETGIAFLDEVDRTVEGFATCASADIAFIAKLEMQSLRRELDTMRPDWDHWRVIELCERIRRHTVKAITALRRMLGQEVGLSFPQDEIYVTELARSIQVRRRHAGFRARVLAAGQVYPQAPEPRLRLVGTSIAMLICRREYRDFRIGDRVLIRQVQLSILTFLRDRDRSVTQAQRIWQDVLGMIEITRQINNRPELLEHDCLMLGTLAAAVERLRPGEDASHLLDQARVVTGRDDVLDQLVAAGLPVDLVSWREAVGAARAALGKHEAPDSANEEILEAASRSGVWARPSPSANGGTIGASGATRTR